MCTVSYWFLAENKVLITKLTTEKNLNSLEGLEPFMLHCIALCLSVPLRLSEPLYTSLHISASLYASLHIFAPLYAFKHISVPLHLFTPLSVMTFKGPKISIQIIFLTVKVIGNIIDGSSTFNLNH